MLGQGLPAYSHQFLCRPPGCMCHVLPEHADAVISMLYGPQLDVEQHWCQRTVSAGRWFADCCEQHMCLTPKTLVPSMMCACSILSIMQQACARLGVCALPAIMSHTALSKTVIIQHFRHASIPVRSQVTTTSPVTACEDPSNAFKQLCCHDVALLRRCLCCACWMTGRCRHGSTQQ